MTRLRITYSLLWLIFFITSNTANAVVLGEFVALSKEMQQGYVNGVFDSLRFDKDRTKDEIECLSKWGSDGAWSVLHDFVTKNNNPKAGGINVAVLILLNADTKCDSGKTTNQESTQLTLAKFTNLSKDEQVGYVSGVFDSNIVNAKYSNERTECIESWGFMNMWNYMLDYYNKDKNSPAVFNANPAIVLQKGAFSNCGDDRRDMTKLKPVK